VRKHADKQLFTATKIPPKNLQWPARSEYSLSEVFPPDHIRKYVESSLSNLGLDHLDLIQFHVWNDAWANDESWQRTIEDLKREGSVVAAGISVNRWEPENCIQTLKTGLIQAVQVIYNIFDQAPEDQLFPVCRELNLAVIARVPFDEGSLTGSLTKESKWPDGDWRNIYFGAENLNASVDRAKALRSFIPKGMTMPEVALRFILGNRDVSTIIPGMRKIKHVEANIATSDQGPLPELIRQQLRKHRWDRKPAPWSD
jgi:aryl-alcohol dehydrogenase-like predicted oxidoreductase